MGILDELESLFPDDAKASAFTCDNCSEHNGMVRFACACGFRIEICAKCLGDNKGEVLSQLGMHAGECEKGRHLLRALTL